MYYLLIGLGGFILGLFTTVAIYVWADGPEEEDIDE